MAKVYIVQENPNVNVIGAARFGELIPMLPPGRQITLSPAPVIITWASGDCESFRRVFKR